MDSRRARCAASRRRERFALSAGISAAMAWDSLLSYLRLRAIPGVEYVDGTHYRRTVAIGDKHGWIAVTRAKSGVAVELEMSQSLAPVIGAVIVRVKHLFDLGAVPDSVAALLSQDPDARPRRAPPAGTARPGGLRRLRTRGARGSRPAGIGAGRDHPGGALGGSFGAPLATPFPELNRLTPDAERMAAVAADDIAALGIVGSRARALAALAQAVTERRVVLSYAANVEEQIEALQRLPGIGPWTAQYIAMRALHWPDAFPGGDLMLLKAAQVNKRELHARAEAWRPWRAYAAHYLMAIVGGLSVNSYTYVDSPIGRLLLSCDGECLTGVYMDVPSKSPREMQGWVQDANAAPLPATVRQLSEYFAGTRREFDLPLRLDGTPFQQRVWQSLTEIPYGETWSYGELAKRIGNPNASRAVGLANGSNPIAILVPCHRVIGADGSLTGYGGGLDRKRWLLAHEGLH
jgi:AraC family transcriptional regulator of adaptative response / DNA-3-methyladenine glycosylase II